MRGLEPPIASAAATTASTARAAPTGSSQRLRSSVRILLRPLCAAESGTRSGCSSSGGSGGVTWLAFARKASAKLVLKLSHDLSFSLRPRASSARWADDLTVPWLMPMRVAISVSGRSR